MVSVCLPSDALLQHLLSYLGFSYLGRGVSLHSFSSKLQPLLLTLDKGYLLPSWPWTWSSSSQPSCTRAASTPWTWGSSSRPLLCHQPGTLGCCPWPWARGSSSRPHFCMVHHSQNTSVMTIINENLFIAIPVLTLLWSSIDLRVRFIFFSYTDLLSSYMFTFFFFFGIQPYLCDIKILSILKICHILCHFKVSAGTNLSTWNTILDFLCVVNFYISLRFKLAITSLVKTFLILVVCLSTKHVFLYFMWFA